MQSSLIPLYRMLVVSTVFAIVGVLIYFILPERKERILPSKDDERYLFYDGQSGGKTMAEWVDKEKYIFKCSYSSSESGWPYCGLRFKVGTFPEGKDYSSYQRLEVKLNYQGSNQRLRMTMRNYSPAFFKEGDLNTLKGSDVHFAVDETHDVIEIHQHEWRVSEYWVQINKVPRWLSYSEFNHIVDVSVDLMPPLVAGEHFIQIEYVDLYGELLAAETWYLGVALFWLATNLLFITRHLYSQETRISADSERLSKYKVLSTTDPLTGALNRNGFAEEMSQNAPDGRLSANTALILIDIDNFKRINDTHGHDAGDALLREVASIIRLNVLGSDKLIRWGGEEFILFCKDTNERQAMLVAEKVREVVEQLKVLFNSTIIPVTISLGVGVAKEKENFDELFHRTDQAMYEAKNRGRNRVVLAE